MLAVDTAVSPIQPAIVARYALSPHKFAYIDAELLLIETPADALVQKKT